MSKLRVLDLFSGIGGFSLGLERTGGFETVAFCEIEPFPRRVLAKHWPGVPCYDDVRTLTGSQIGAVDVICGGFPCQDISASGSGHGLAGQRSGLWCEMVRIIGEFRPSYVIVENSSNLLSGADGRWMGAVLGDLAALGYNAEWHVISASAIGAPHKRERIWIIAHAAGVRQSGQGQLLQSVYPAPDAFRQADRLVDAFRERSVPFVCRGHDGISTQLDGGLNAISETRPVANLSKLCDTADEEKVLNGASGGSRPVSSEKVLRHSVPGASAVSTGRNAQANDDVSGQKTQGRLLCQLWGDGATAHSPSGPQHSKQPARQFGDTLRALSQPAACRSDRLKALGNAVVPAIPELIGRAILQARSVPK